MFRAHVFIVRRAKLYYTVSGIITPIGVLITLIGVFISSLYMFRAHVLIVRRAKLYYTVSGIITPIGVMIPTPYSHHPQLPFLPQCQRPGFTPIQNNRQNYSSIHFNL